LKVKTPTEHAMQHEIRYAPAFSLVRLMMDPGDSVRAESGAMVSMSPTITMESKMSGGIGKALGRMFGGESLFQTTFTASHGPGELLLAPSALGDIVALNLSSEGYMVTSGCFLAGDTGLGMETKVSGKAFFGGEGLFILRISGSGLLLLSSFGAIHSLNLAAGQPYIVDTGHIVAFSETMNYQVHAAGRSLLGAFTSGEGYVAHFQGPGTLYIQSRAPASFGSWIGQFIPSRS
jgi:uncharacterized protein (TIGR00266 family)